MSAKREAQWRAMRARREVARRWAMAAAGAPVADHGQESPDMLPILMAHPINALLPHDPVEYTVALIRADIQNVELLSREEWAAVREVLRQRVREGRGLIGRRDPWVSPTLDVRGGPGASQG